MIQVLDTIKIIDIDPNELTDNLQRLCIIHCAYSGGTIGLWEYIISPTEILDEVLDEEISDSENG